MNKSINTLKTLIETGQPMTAIRFAFSAIGPFADNEEVKNIVMQKIGIGYIYGEADSGVNDAINFLRMQMLTDSIANSLHSFE